MAPSKFKEISISSSRQYHKKSNSWIRNEKYLYDISKYIFRNFEDFRVPMFVSLSYYV